LHLVILKLTVGLHPIAPGHGSGHDYGMDHKMWLIELEVAACLAAMALLAFTLMVGYALWRYLAGR